MFAQQSKIAIVFSIRRTDCGLRIKKRIFLWSKRCHFNRCFLPIVVLVDSLLNKGLLFVNLRQPRVLFLFNGVYKYRVYYSINTRRTQKARTRYVNRSGKSFKVSTRSLKDTHLEMRNLKKSRAS